ncbi:PEP-CTERM sorting domain-containing protein [Methylomonas sp. AM2-LC]|uniref:PEP-CTERM sorting domain-containing protein n=1 Tax=Methylomonas sp. AM2-LC TaxID=3153301 RepID=UPI0032674EE9
MRTSLPKIATLLVALALVNTQAVADTILSTADYNVNEPGDYVIDSSNYLATSFTLTQAEQITSIGGHFTQFGDGNNIFAEITSVTAQGLPTSTVLAQVNFAPNTDGTDSSTAFSVLLGPGTYDIIFGGNTTTAPGSSGLASGQDITGNATFYQSTDSGVTWSTLAANDLRVVVQGTAVSAVPLPSSLPLLLSGLGLLGFSMKKRTAK